MVADKNVLLTGGAGSVARALIPQILAREPGVLRVFDNSESGLAGLKAEVSDDRCRYLAGDVRDEKRLARAMEDIDIVIHTAGMKHVDVCEYNPFEAVKTNVLGLQNVVDAAINAEAERVVFTSSDKAVNPANTMGTTKLLGERLITAGNKHKGRENLRLTSVRFGNIVDSSHSVVPLFTEQIRSGGPVQLTDERMTRFFLTYNDVFDLITQALDQTQGGEVFVYKMPAISIKDLAEAMVDVLAPSFGHEPTDIDIELIGRRTGETYHEEIMTARETERAYENDDLYAIRPEASEYLSYDEPQGMEPTDEIVRSSKDATKLSKSEIVSLLEANDAIDQ
jgi:UDP-N-acetylglucosamine 4,6-dehydratase